MSDPAQHAPQRDAETSRFQEILSTLERATRGFVAAVFFDNEGETIDYHSYLDPYSTRLVAAHHGVTFQSLVHRMDWLAGGSMLRLDIVTAEMETTTLPLGEGLFLTVCLKRDDQREDIEPVLATVIVELREECGLG